MEELRINKQQLLDAISEARTGYHDAMKEAKLGLLPYEHVEKWSIKLSAFNWILEISEELNKLEYVWVNFDPLIEKVLCVHRKLDGECKMCKKHKEERTSYHIETFKFKIRD